MKDPKERNLPFWYKSLLMLCIGCIVVFSIFTVLTYLEATTGLYRSGRLIRSELNKILPTYEDQSTTPQASLLTPIITPVEEDTSCLARSQHLLYRRNPERFAPSPEFERVWNRYTLKHKACTHKRNWTHVFLYERDKHDDCNYLVLLENSGGLGNKLLALMSALAYAIATDRIILVDGRRQYKILCDPFPGSSWLLPEEFPIDTVWDGPSLNVAISNKFNNTDLVTLHLDHIQSWADQQFFCNHTQFQLINVRWVAWRTNQYYVTNLFTIPPMWESLHPLFNVTDMFTQLSHQVLLPRNDLWALILRHYLGYLSASSTRVGLQIRLHGRPNLAEYDQDVFDRILNCLQTHKVLPKLQEKDDIYNIIQKVANVTPSADIAVLVTSLQSRYFDELKNLYLGRPNEDNAALRFHMVSSLGTLLPHSVVSRSESLYVTVSNFGLVLETLCSQGHQDGTIFQTESAMVEMWLLSFTDVLVISAKSTFGYVPQGIGGARTLLLNVRRRSDVDPDKGVSNLDERSCFVAQSSEPCTHKPMKPKCEGPNTISKPHAEWMQKHLQECQDWPGGLQLVFDAEKPNNSSHMWDHLSLQ